MTDITRTPGTATNTRCRLLGAGSLALAMSIGVAPTAIGQSGGVAVYAHGGYHNSLTDLAVGTGDRLGSGFAVGGGLSLMLGRHGAIRAYLSRVRTTYRGPTLAVQDSAITRVFYGGDIMVGRTTEAGIAPYLFGGMGAVSVNPRDPDRPRFTRLAGRLGAGFNYPLSRSPLTPFMEGSFWIYRFKRFGFDRTLVDFSATVGLALAVPF